jgi:hypothetical protein
VALAVVAQLAAACARAGSAAAVRESKVDMPAADSDPDILRDSADFVVVPRR